jgi:heat shock protein HtpX
LRRLDRDELQGVVAHEIAHVRNLDVRFLTLASVMVGSIVLLADLFLRASWHGSGRRRSRRGGGAEVVLIVAALAAAILAPLAANALYFACSRRREYLADASAACFTRYPEGLASALEKIAATPAAQGPAGAHRALAPLYTVNPLAAAGGTGLFATHPPTAERVRVLRGMAGGAGLAEYERAFRRATGRSAGCLDPASIAAAPPVEKRGPRPVDDRARDAAERARAGVALLDRLAGWALVVCPCGLRIKLPPGRERAGIRCPRCGRPHEASGPESKT